MSILTKRFFLLLLSIFFVSFVSCSNTPTTIFIYSEGFAYENSSYAVSLVKSELNMTSNKLTLQFSYIQKIENITVGSFSIDNLKIDFGSGYVQFGSYSSISLSEGNHYQAFINEEESILSDYDYQQNAQVSITIEFDLNELLDAIDETTYNSSILVETQPILIIQIFGGQLGFVLSPTLIS
jgi:hypothetical protein